MSAARAPGRADFAALLHEERSLKARVARQRVILRNTEEAVRAAHERYDEARRRADGAEAESAEGAMLAQLRKWLERRKALGHITPEQAAFADELLLECWGVQ